jgi:hypothetical protein
MLFKTLLSSLQSLSRQEIVMAQDISSSGQKTFIKDTLEPLKQLYETCTDKHWYECLVENRPSRIFLDIESTASVDLSYILTKLAEAVQLKFQIEPNIKVLDSCSNEKQSWHVICTNVYLKNVYHVGAFIRRFVLSLKEHPCREAIDTAVYTKNRMFRIKGSRKFGSTRVLKHEDPWWTLLVQAVDVPFHECKEIDESTPVSTSIKPEQMFVCTEAGEWKRFRTSVSPVDQSRTTCPMLSPILDWLDRNMHAQTCRHNCSFNHRGHYRVSTRSKRCQIVGREHRGNNIWFDIDVHRQLVFQRCYDEECRYKFHIVTVPTLLWDAWKNSWHQVIHAPRNKNTLFNMSY